MSGKEFSISPQPCCITASRRLHPFWLASPANNRRNEKARSGCPAAPCFFTSPPLQSAGQQSLGRPSSGQSLLHLLFRFCQHKQQTVSELVEQFGMQHQFFSPCVLI